MAPFTPFSAEDIWSRLHQQSRIHDSQGESELSVHLCSWPEAREVNQEILKNMEEVRKIVSLGLQLRQKNGIPVRQPLASLKLKVKSEKLSSEYLELIKDELNVKEIVQDETLSEEVEFDINITDELKQEGNYRELLRAIQDMRKKIGLTTSDKVSLFVGTDEKGKELIKKFEKDMKKTVLAEEIKFEKNDGEEIKIGIMSFKITIEK